MLLKAAGVHPSIHHITNAISSTYYDEKTDFNCLKAIHIKISFKICDTLETS